MALLFAASGCAALIYEIVWIQLLEFVIGASAVSTALVLATFMGGLCLGSLELPRLISPTRHPLRVYAALELCIGAVGVLVLSAIPRVGAVYAASVGRGLPGMLLRGTAGAVCLLPPTLLMGATFPAVARWIGTAPERVPWLGFVYSCNIAGSVFGALLAGFYLLRVYDVTTATYVAVSINVGVGLVAVSLATKAQRSSAPLPSRDEPAHSVSRHSPVYLVIAASGACALGAEVVWTRLLALTLGATVYTFSIVLSVFLTGLGIGGGAGSLIARRSRDPQLALGICQLPLAAAIGWTALAGIVAQWVPLYESNPDVVKSEIATFFKSFPNGTIWANNDRGQGYDLVLIGQEGAARIDIDAVQQKLERADYQRVAASLHDVDFDSAIELLSTYTGQASDLRPWLRGAEINRDRSLRLQYLAGMAVDSDKNASIYESVAAYRHFPDNVFVGDQASMRTLREAIAEPSTCRLSVDDLNWVQDALDGWQQISQDAPGVPPAPLPWTVLFDSSCVWHLAPAVGQPPDGTAIHTPLSFASNPVEVRALRHNDTVALPNGLTIPARATAMSSLTSDGISPFVAMALPEVWRLNARDAKAQPANELLQTMMIAELAKSGHRQELQRHLQALAPTQSLPRPIREDTVQMQFQSVPGFREAFEAERDLFFRAAREGDARERNALTMRGLAMARQRRAQYFTGGNRAYAALEDFLLTLDGAGQWAAYQFVKTRVPSTAEADVLQFVRDQRKYWSQEEGLALFLLLNALVPDWQARVFGPAPVPPFALLEDAMRANPGVASR